MAAGTVYGHRAVLGTKSKFLPDQAGGCRFEGEDEPGISSAVSGTVLGMNLDFKGELIDTRDNSQILEKHWWVTGTGTVPK